MGHVLDDVGRHDALHRPPAVNYGTLHGVASAPEG
jgi:hypothetical protein